MLDPLDSYLELFMALILIIISIALIQSDTFIIAVRRAVNNGAALPFLLITDLASGIDSLTSSRNVQQIISRFAAIAKHGLLACQTTGFRAQRLDSHFIKPKFRVASFNVQHFQDSPRQN
ncbi:hypothetical protein E4T42_09268 [Aureobasidium subglaciale]|nr:hypothetical protein E4T42_09268 [Aureobasidium subglaciale]